MKTLEDIQERPVESPVTTTVYAGFVVKPIYYYGQPYFHNGKYITHGYSVTRQDEPGINPVPGAAAIFTKAEAMQTIDIMKAVDPATSQDQRFWHLLRAIQRQSQVEKEDAEL